MKVIFDNWCMSKGIKIKSKINLIEVIVLILDFLNFLIIFVFVLGFNFFVIFFIVFNRECGRKLVLGVLFFSCVKLFWLVEELDRKLLG